MGTTKGEFLEEVALVGLVGRKNNTPWKGAKSGDRLEGTEGVEGTEGGWTIQN